MDSALLREAIEKLESDFSDLDFDFYDAQIGGTWEKIYRWPGPPDEDILIYAQRTCGSQTLFHRHDFFFFNFTYLGQYESIDRLNEQNITIEQNELYVGQPFAGHAHWSNKDQEMVMISVLLKRDAIFRSFRSLLSSNSKMLSFFVDPNTQQYSEKFFHFKVEDNCAIRSLLEMMVVEYAFPKPDTQEILKPLVLAFIMQINRQYLKENSISSDTSLSEQILTYMNDNIGNVNLKGIASRFSYHPNYLSTVMRKEIGKTFSQLLLELRMERAAILLNSSTLSVEEISYMLGYSNSSNFHKAFRRFFHCTPREYILKKDTTK